MSTINYSVEALNVLSFFHSSNFSVFVEGDDDEEFWSQIFDLSEISSYHIESVGGKDQLREKVDKIVSENAQIIVATDRDYSDYVETEEQCNRLLRTYGHSIENILYCKASLSRIITKLSRKRRDISDVIDAWELDFMTKSTELLKYDIANIKYSKSLTVLGDNCCRFLSNKTSPYLCDKKITSHIDSIKGNFDNNEIETVSKMIEADQRNIWHIIKGHFITHTSINLVKSITRKISGKSVTLSSDSFYALAVDGCALCSTKCDAIHEMIAHTRDAWLSLEMNSI